MKKKKARYKRQRLWKWGATLLYMAFIFWLSSMSRPPLPAGFLSADKLAHLLLYAGLGGLAGIAVAGETGRRPSLLSVLLVTAYGMTDEFHQSFVPGRSADIRDVGADMAGALLAQAAICLWVRVRSAAAARAKARA